MGIFFRSMCLCKFFMGKIIKDNSVKHLKKDGAKEGISARTLKKANSISGSNKCEIFYEREWVGSGMKFLFRKSPGIFLMNLSNLPTTSHAAAARFLGPRSLDNLGWSWKETPKSPIKPMWPQFMAFSCCIFSIRRQKNQHTSAKYPDLVKSAFPNS